MITKEEMKDWKEHPITQEVFKTLKESQRSYEREAISLGKMPTDNTSTQLAALWARHDMIDEVLNMEADE